jgi:hypothetical protein
MILWHDIENALRSPQRVRPKEPVSVTVGSYPREPGEFVTVFCRTIRKNGEVHIQRIDGHRQFDDPVNNQSYWIAELGAFELGDKVEYTISGVGLEGDLPLHVYKFEVS